MRRKYFTFNNAYKHAYLRRIRIGESPVRRHDRLPPYHGADKTQKEKQEEQAGNDKKTMGCILARYYDNRCTWKILD